MNIVVKIQLNKGHNGVGSKSGNSKRDKNQGKCKKEK